MPNARWTPAEYEILESCSLIEAHRLIPHRTTTAIKSARRDRHVGIPRKRWTKAEDRRLRKYGHEPLARLAKRFKRRSKNSVNQRRMIVIGTHRLPWKVTELRILQQLYPLAKRAALEAAFPNRTWESIKWQAAQVGVRRTITVKTAACELREAIRNRAREDGIAFARLGVQTGCGTYFCQTAPKTINLDKIARAVEFFGGKLVIDWQDE